MRLTFLLTWLAIIALALCLSCKAHQPNGTHATGDGIVRAQTLNESMVNHAKAYDTQPAMDALLSWVHNRDSAGCCARQERRRGKK